FSEAWSSIRMNLSTTFAATMTVLIGMCLLGLFIGLGTWVLSWSNHIQKELQVHVYFASDATQAQDQSVGAVLRHGSRAQHVLYVIASTLLIANTIRLSIFARRREIEVMKLVGATNWFIRGPFMLEGLVCGLFGSAFAVILLVVGKAVALPSILPHIGGTSSDVHALPFTLNAFALLGTGLLLGATGSLVTLRRFLQV